MELKIKAEFDGDNDTQREEEVTLNSSFIQWTCDQKLGINSCLAKNLLGGNIINEDIYLPG